MIFQPGDIFDGGHSVLVNPVNCRGVMGAGLALKFKQLSEDYFRSYLKACASKELDIGKCHIFEELPGCYVVSLPTKLSWKDPSKLKYVEQGLISLRRFLITQPEASVGIPALGCGLGKLDWSDVRPLIQERLSGLDCTIRIYAE